MFKVPRHIWRTTDGRLVQHGDLDAAFLAYPAGEEFTDHDAEAKGLLAVYPNEKAVDKPADKAVAKPADKAAAKSGVTINRRTDTKET